MRPVSKKALKAFQEWGKGGGKKRAKNLSFARRRAIARHAAQMRWNQQGEGKTSMPSVRLKEVLWEDPVYLEEVLSYGSLNEWKGLRRMIADRPFGSEAAALEKVLDANEIYGTTSLWKGILRHLQGNLS